MSKEQKTLDFQQLAAVYAKHYAPYEWKRDTGGFDLLDIRSWLARVERSRDDIEFYEICVEYVASLNDAHSVFTLPSDFVATLGFSVDLYDHVPLVEAINRAQLPLAEYPIAMGDELISIDGVPVNDVIVSLAKYAVAANNRSTARIATNLLTIRPQSLIPRAIEVPDQSTLVFRGADGEQKILTLPWRKTGTPLTSAGTVLTPKAREMRAAQAVDSVLLPDDGPWMAPLRMLQNVKLSGRAQAVVGYGSRTPVFAMPSNFRQRLGREAADVFFSGTYEADGLTIGFIRIPNYFPPNQALAVQQFMSEMAFFQGNTDGLIIDQTRNPGGNLCYLETLLRLVIPYEFRTAGVQIRATSNWVNVFSSSVTLARAMRAEQWVIDLLESLLEDVRQANSETRGMTGPLPVCGRLALQTEPARDNTGNLLAYTKPVMVLADDLSASGGDVFAAVFQDNKRGPVLGWRTMGAGGTVIGMDATTFSEGFAGVTASLLTRKDYIATEDFPSTPLIENVGVRPDLRVDYQTRENLMSRGRPFVDTFTWFMVHHIRDSR
jgi:C-terminal processing protease CtpA/Prc